MKIKSSFSTGWTTCQNVLPLRGRYLKTEMNALAFIQKSKIHPLNNKVEFQYFPYIYNTY